MNAFVKPFSLQLQLQEAQAVIGMATVMIEAEQDPTGYWERRRARLEEDCAMIRALRRRAAEISANHVRGALEGQRERDR